VKQRNIPYNDVYRGKHEHDANNIMMFCHPVRYPCAATNRMANFSPTDAWHQSYKTAPTCHVKTYPAQYIWLYIILFCIRQQQLEAWLQAFCNRRSANTLTQRSRWAHWHSR
jgi:hypothetical protein